MPLEDLREIHALQNLNYSIADEHFQTEAGLRDLYQAELAHQSIKLEKYSTSSKLLNRLSNIAGAAGDLEQEHSLLHRAANCGANEYLRRRIAENEMARGNLDVAKVMFEGLLASGDLWVNLRLAHVMVLQNNVETAMDFVRRAIEIEPDNFSARLFEGGLGLIRGDFERAVHSYRIAEETRPQSASLYHNLAIAYANLEMPTKALGAAKKSVALAPMNANSVCLLADVAFMYSRDRDAIGSLRLLVSLEQKSAAIWARHARACMRLGEVQEAIAALKREASVEESCRVWNNLGVAYQATGQAQRSGQAFARAVELGSDSKSSSYFLACRNTAQFLFSNSEWAHTVRFVETVLEEDKEGLCFKDLNLIDLPRILIQSFRTLNRFKDLEIQCLSILSRPDIEKNLEAWTTSMLLTHYALSQDSLKKASALLAEKLPLIELNNVLTDVERTSLINNFAFALAEMGDVKAAELMLSRISNLIHLQPYPTATLGLIHFRKGNLYRGKSLYDQAIGLAVGHFHKTRIRQKLNFELGKFWLPYDQRKAVRYLEKASGDSVEPSIAQDASRLAKSISYEAATKDPE